MKGGFIRVNKSLGKYVFSRYEISISPHYEND